MNKKFLEFFRKNIYLIVLLFISVIVYNRFLFNFDIFVFDDFVFHFAEELKELSFYPQGWLANKNMGVMDGQPFFYLKDLMIGVLARLGLEWNILERIFYFWPIVFVSPIASFLFFKKVIDSNIASFIASLFYSYNTYLAVTLHYGFLNITVAHVFTPLFLFFLVRYLEEEKRKFLFGTTFVGLIITTYDFRVFYAIALACFLYLFLYIVISGKWNRLFKVAANLSIPFIIIVGLNSFWLINFFSAQGDYNYILNRGLQTVWEHNLLSALTLHHPYYGAGVTLHGGTFNVLENIPFYFWLIPVLALLGVILNRKNARILACASLTFIFVLIVKQEAPPLTGLYKWLYYNIPGFNALREAGKLYFIVAMGYAGLIGVFFKWLWENWNNKAEKKKIIIKHISLLIFFLFLLLNTVHLARGKDPIFTPKVIPQDYEIFKKFILAQPEYFSVLWVPNASKQWSAAYSNKRPSLGLASMLLDWGWKDFIPHKYKNGYYPYAEEIVRPLKTSSFDKLLDVSSVKYIAIQLNDRQPFTESFIDLALMYGDKEFFISELDQLRFLKKINIGTKELTVYENEDFKPLLYITKEKETIYSNISFQPVKYDFINSTEYKVYIENLSNPIYLNFSQSYHPGWKLRAGDFFWWETLRGRDYFLFENNHIKNDANLNSFFVDPKEICLSSVFCQENADSSYNIEFTLFFKPQSYFYLGLIVSAFVLIGLSGYSLYNFQKRRVRRLGRF